MAAAYATPLPAGAQEPAAATAEEASAAVPVPDWLRLLHKRAWNGVDRAQVMPVWALVFKLARTGAGDTLEISEECRSMIERIVDAQLQFAWPCFSRDQDEIFINVGATEGKLMEECTYHMDVPMKRQSPCTLLLPSCHAASSIINASHRAGRGTRHSVVPGRVGCVCVCVCTAVRACVRAWQSVAGRCVPL
jgi:hypothetical protein